MVILWNSVRNWIRKQSVNNTQGFACFLKIWIEICFVLWTVTKPTWYHSSFLFNGQDGEYMVNSFRKDTVRVYSYQAKIEEWTTNIKENFLFRLRFGIVWMYLTSKKRYQSHSLSGITPSKKLFFRNLFWSDCTLVYTLINLFTQYAFYWSSFSNR